MAKQKSQAWKMVYIDFLNSMMVFFMTMWIVQTLKPQQNILAQESNTTVVQEKNESKKPSSTNKQDIKKMSTQDIEVRVKENLSKKLSKKDVTQMSNHLLLKQTPLGIVIMLTDSKSESMFERGSCLYKKNKEPLLLSIVETLNSVTGKIKIVGHTDATPFAQKNYTNWDLSLDRASMVRLFLMRNLDDSSRIVALEGRSSNDLLTPQNPTDAVNRRVEIIILQGDAL